MTQMKKKPELNGSLDCISSYLRASASSADYCLLSLRAPGVLRSSIAL